MKTKEELNALKEKAEKEKAETLNGKGVPLTDEALEQVTGGGSLTLSEDSEDFYLPSCVTK